MSERRNLNDNNSVLLWLRSFESVNLPERNHQTFGITLINCSEIHFLAVVIALGWLVSWHLKLIKRGETSIEAHTNRTEAKRMALAGVKFQNPYDFGPEKNLALFFGLVDGKTFWRHFLVPSAHAPLGNGLSFETNRAIVSNDFP